MFVTRACLDLHSYGATKDQRGPLKTRGGSDRVFTDPDLLLPFFPFTYILGGTGATIFGDGTATPGHTAGLSLKKE